MTRVLRGAWRALCVAVIALGVLVVGAAVVVPRLGGATPYTILTGSMDPTYPPGTLVVVREADPDEIATGDVVTFQLRSGEPAVATHRVVGVGRATVGDEVVLTTKGDANAAADAEPVRAVQVRGRVWYAVPWLGHVGAAFSAQSRQLVVYVVAGGLLLYAAVMVVAGVRERRAGAARAAAVEAARAATRARAIDAALVGDKAREAADRGAARGGRHAG